MQNTTFYTSNFSYRIPYTLVDVAVIFTTLRCRVNSIFVRLFIVRIRIVSIVLTVPFRSGKSGRRKRKWRERGHGSRTVQT